MRHDSLGRGISCVFIVLFFLKRRAYASFPFLSRNRISSFLHTQEEAKKTLCKKRKCFFTSLENVFFRSAIALSAYVTSLSLCGVHVSVAARLAVKYLDAAVKKRRKILAL